MSQQHTTLTGPLTLLQAAQFTEWFDALAPELVRWLSLRGPITEAMADDIVQETFIRVWRHFDALSAMKPARRRRYVYSIAANVNHDQLRAVVRHDRMSGGAATPVYLSVFADPSTLDAEPVTASNNWTMHAQAMEQTTAARMSLQALWNAVPDVYRELLALLLAGLDEHEIAAQLGISKHAVEQRMCRFRGVMRDFRERIA